MNFAQAQQTYFSTVTIKPAGTSQRSGICTACLHGGYAQILKAFCPLLSILAYPTHEDHVSCNSFMQICTCIQWT